MKTITIVADDKVGLLADISYVLGKAKVNIESITVDMISNKSIITLSLSDIDRGREVLEGAGYSATQSNSVVIKLDDKPGELGRVTTMLSKEGVNIENVHMLSKDGSNTVLSVMVDNPKRAGNVLKEFRVGQETDDF